MINGTYCLQLALSQKSWDLATGGHSKSQRAGRLAVHWSSLAEQKRSKAGLTAFFAHSTLSVPNFPAEILKIFLLKADCELF